MYTVAHFVAEHVVDEAVLGDTAEAFEGGGRNHRVEVMPVADHLGPSTRYSRLDPLFQLLGGSLSKLVWRSRHT